MRQVTPQKPHRSSVSTSTTSKMSLTKPSLGKGNRPERPPSQDDRTYPAGALAAMLVVGVVLGLLFAALISAFVGGDDSSSSRPNGSASPSTGSAGSGGQSDLDTTQRSDQIRANSAPENRDVRVYACGVDADGYASARVLITNGGDDSATYHVRVIFASAADGDIISDDVASVKNLAPGTSAPLQSVDAVDRAPDGNVVCRLGSVSRF
jgi:hypothetical protein